MSNIQKPEILNTLFKITKIKQYDTLPFLEYLDAFPKNKFNWWAMQVRHFGQAIPSQKLDKCIDTIVQKNAFYGIESLLLVGTKGIAVRCIDKICRINNIIEQQKESDAKDMGESLQDSIMDLYNYCLLACIILNRGYQ